MNLDRVACSVLMDTVFFLERLDREPYGRKLDVFSGSSIGQHTRHLVEFFQCLLVQAEAGIIDYDARERNHQIETDPVYAAKVIRDLLPRLNEVAEAKALTLKVDYLHEEGSKAELPTTFARELIYNIEHAIHHLALIKIGLKVTSPTLVLPESFGVAPSTLAYWQYQGQR